MDTEPPTTGSQNAPDGTVEELRAATAFLDAIVDNSPFAMWVSDSEGTVVRTNRALRETLNLSDEQLIGKYNVLRDANLDRQGIRAQVRSVFEQHASVRFSVWWTAAQAGDVAFGSARDLYLEASMFPILNAEGSLTNVVCQWVDITARKAMEVRLQTSETEQKWLLHSMINAFVIFESVFDDEGRFISYRFEYINEAYERITGVLNDEVKGKTVHEVWPETEPEWIERYGEVAVSGTSKTFDLFHAPTNKLYHCTVYRPWDTQDRFCVVFDDVTELRKAHDELEDRVSQRTIELEAANRELETFAYSVSHDLRAPLRAVEGFAEIIADRHADTLNEESREYFGYIVQAGKQMERLIDDLLLYSRVGRKAVQLEPVPLHDILDNLADKLRPQATELGATVTLPDDLPTVRGNLSLLLQVFQNLLENALKYHISGTPPVVTVSVEIRAMTAVIVVADNGIGIAPEFHAKVFDIFQRLHTEDEYPGTGVGLAIVKKAVTLMNGSIGVESEEGHGSRFSVKLPLVG